MAAKLKFSGLAQAGQTLRGHDFHPAISPGESYVEGVVLETECLERGCLDYKILVTRRMLAGQDQPDQVGTTGYIPHEVAMFEFDGRVELVSSPAKPSVLH